MTQESKTGTAKRSAKSEGYVRMSLPYKTSFHLRLQALLAGGLVMLRSQTCGSGSEACVNGHFLLGSYTPGRNLSAASLATSERGPVFRFKGSPLMLSQRNPYIKPHEQESGTALQCLTLQNKRNRPQAKRLKQLKLLKHD